MKCFTCDGSGEVDRAEYEARKKAEAEFWCSCGNPSEDVRFYDDGEHPKCDKHCYECVDCGKIRQVG